jgi:insulysin
MTGLDRATVTKVFWPSFPTGSASFNMQETLDLPDSDDRSYRLFSLENQLEVLLIHDDDTEKAGAALDVGAGSLCDPGDSPGIAHAVEHLLSMGTLEYPQENAYDEYLSEYSGFSNAVTSTSSTNFYFELTYPRLVSHSIRGKDCPREAMQHSVSPLRGALDRFGQMFISPIFWEDSVKREIQAIDSEFKESMQDDAQRLYQLHKSLANPQHPYSRFAFGSWKTLYEDTMARGIAPRDACLEYLSRNYTPDKMKLVVLGRESLDTLEAWTRQIFSAIPERSTARSRWQTPIYTSTQLVTQTFVRPVHELRLLQFQFVYPDEEDLFESHPSWYLIHLLSHKGPGSLFALLRSRGWADEVKARTHTVCPGSSLFYIDVEMTKVGASRYQAIVVLAFQYISMLQQASPQESVVRELIHMSQIKFRLQGKSTLRHTVSTLARTLQNPYRGSKLFSGPVTIQSFSPGLIEEATAFLRPDNVRLIVVDPNDTVGWDRREPWYRTEYKHEPIPAGFLGVIQKAYDDRKRPLELHLPKKNNHLPNLADFQCLSIEPSTKRPILIAHTDLVRTWLQVSGEFDMPRPRVHLYFRTVLVGIDVRSELITSLFVQLVQDALIVPLHDAVAAGQDYEMCSHSGGIDIGVSSCGVKLQQLLKAILVHLKAFAVDCKRFHIVHDRMINSIRNEDHEQPWKQIVRYSNYFRSDKSFAFEDRVQTLKSITLDEVRTFFPHLFEQCQVELFAHGNFSRKQVLDLTDLVERVMRPTKIARDYPHPPKSVVLPSGSDIVYEQTLTDPENVNNCIEYSLHVGNCYDRSLRAKLYLLAQLIEEPCFHQLRTTEQLGYIVRSSHVFLHAWAGLSILLQSEYSCGHLESRISAFLRTFEATLLEMSAEKFKSHRDALTEDLRASYVNFSEADARLWKHIYNNSYNFSQGW